MVHALLLEGEGVGLALDLAVLLGGVERLDGAWSADEAGDGEVDDRMQGLASTGILGVFGVRGIVSEYRLEVGMMDDLE